MTPDELYTKIVEDLEPWKRGFYFGIQKRGMNWPYIDSKIEPPPLENLAILQYDVKAKPTTLKWLRACNPKRVQVHTRCSQELLDEICDTASVEEIEFVVPGGFTDISGLEKLTKLKRLYFSTANGVSDFSVLSRMSDLQHLGFYGHFKSIDYLSSVVLPSGLLSLDFRAVGSHKINLESLDFVSRCTELIRLGLFSVKVSAGGFKPLGDLKNIEFISLSPYQLKAWSQEDYKILYEKLPKLKTFYIKLAATDPEFQKLHKIKPT